MADATVRGVRLHYQRIGATGAPVRVAFVHGLLMDNLSSWYFTVANEVATFGEVLLYDLRGHGYSERPAAGYGVDEHVHDLAALLDATLGQEPVVLVGNSFGTLVATAFARRFGPRVRGLVLVDGHLGDADFGARMAETLSLRGEQAERKIAESFSTWLGRHSHRKRTRLADQARALVEGTSLVVDLRATPPLGAADFERITAPTLALYGERSELLERSANLIARMPHARLEVLPGCTHSVLWEATDDVRARIVAFCSSLCEVRT
jgi:pimeloyl-ACP methyl ester carboxylesterase